MTIPVKDISMSDNLFPASGPSTTLGMIAHELQSLKKQIGSPSVDVASLDFNSLTDEQVDVLKQKLGLQSASTNRKATK